MRVFAISWLATAGLAVAMVASGCRGQNPAACDESAMLGLIQGVPASAVAPPSMPADSVIGVVVFPKGTGSRAAILAYGGTVIYEFQTADAILASIPAGNLSALERDPRVIEIRVSTAEGTVDATCR